MLTSVCQTVSANTDVLGKGIRINYHFTMFLLAIIPHTPITERILNTLCLTAGASSAGLLLTAIVQTAQHQFSLFHALFILHILYSLGIGISPMGNYHVTGSRIAMAVLLQLVLVFSFIAWGSYLWVNVKDFGSQPECNDRIKYVILFFTVRATAPWLRFLWIAFFAFLGAQVLVSLFGSAAIFFIIKREMKREIEEWAQEVDSNAHWVRMTETQDARQYTVINWYFHLDTSRIFYTIYATVMLELTVARNTAHILPDGTNNGPGVVLVDDAWEFGQVLSVVMIFVNLKEVLHCLFDNLTNAAHQAEGYSGLDSQPLTTTHHTRRSRTQTSTSTVHRWYSSISS